MRTERGFTLLELSLAVFILGLMAAVAAPQLSSGQPSLVDLSAAQSARIFRYTRAEARRTGIPHGVKIDSTSNSLEAFRLDTSTNPPAVIYDVIDPLKKRPYSVDFGTQSSTRLVTLNAANLNYSSECAASNLIVFDARGMPRCSDPMTSRFESGSVTLALGEYSREVVVGAYAGRVSID